ncbi:protein tonB [Stenotrophomonas panacihumi]|nr:protein tonB [Stenotrophomonas panacihumi]
MAMAGTGAGPGSVRKQIESSLVVAGDVYIETDGSVSRLDIDQEEKLPSGVVKLVRDNALQWKFQPVVREGHAVKAIAPMRLRVVAKKLDGDRYEIALRGVSFERYDAKDPQSVAYLKLDAPKYPTDAFRSNAAGTVYLVVKVGRDGKVEDVVAEQVNLRVIGSEGEMAQFRKLFADSAILASKRWTFRVPTEGEAASQPYWSVRIPVSYSLNRDPSEGQTYGQWISYVPGPRQVAPWSSTSDSANFAPDTLVDGGVYMADSRTPKLLTPLQGG